MTNWRGKVKSEIRQKMTFWALFGAKLRLQCQKPLVQSTRVKLELSGGFRLDPLAGGGLDPIKEGVG